MQIKKYKDHLNREETESYSSHPVQFLADRSLHSNHSEDFIILYYLRQSKTIKCNATRQHNTVVRDLEFQHTRNIQQKQAIFNGEKKLILEQQQEQLVYDPRGGNEIDELLSAPPLAAGG